MNDPTYTDDVLAERISRGDWGTDVEAPRVDDVIRLIEERQRRRRTAIGVGLGAGLAAAAVTAVVGFGWNSADTADVPPAGRPTVSQPLVEGPTVSETSGTPTPELTDCRNTSRLLLSHGPYGGTPQRPSQTAFVQNIGPRPCALPFLPTLSIGSKGSATAVGVQSPTAGAAPWVLKPEEALILTVRAPRPSSCVSTNGAGTSRQFIIKLGGNTYTFDFPGMRVDGCAAPALTRVRVAPRHGTETAQGTAN